MEFLSLSFCLCLCLFLDVLSNQCADGGLKVSHRLLLWIDPTCLCFPTGPRVVNYSWRGKKKGLRSIGVAVALCIVYVPAYVNPVHFYPQTVPSVTIRWMDEF